MASTISQLSHQKGANAKNSIPFEDKEDVSDSNDLEFESKTAPTQQKPTE